MALLEVCRLPETFILLVFTKDFNKWWGEEPVVLNLCSSVPARNPRKYVTVFVFLRFQWHSCKSADFQKPSFCLYLQRISTNDEARNLSSSIYVQVSRQGIPENMLRYLSSLDSNGTPGSLQTSRNLHFACIYKGFQQMMRWGTCRPQSMFKCPGKESQKICYGICLP